MKWFAVGVVVAMMVSAPSFAEAHKGRWASHSVRMAGGPAAAKTGRGCERLEAKRPDIFDKSRCKHKVYWDRQYKQLSDSAKDWLRITGNCETRGHPRYYESYHVNEPDPYDGRYQFDANYTAGAAGFTIPVYRVYYREQDVRAWRWRMRTDAGQFDCSAW